MHAPYSRDMPVNYHKLRDLLAVAETGSISAASRRLGLSQPVLSRNLRQLEKQFGATMLHRSPKGVVLTEYGRALAARARLIDAEARRAREEIAQMTGSKAGTISLATAPVPMMMVIPQAVSLMRRQFPDVRVQITEVVYPTVMHTFRESSIDFAVGPVPESGLPPDYRVERLFDIELVVVVKRGHRAARARSLKDLVGEEWIVTGPYAGPGAVIERTFVKYGIAAPRYSMLCDSVAAALHMLAHSELVSFVPRPPAVLAERAGEVVIVPVKERAEPVTISVFMPAQAILTPAAQALVSAIRAFGKRVR